jgi:hypothetical protein
MTNDAPAKGTVAFLQVINNPVKFKLFLLSKLPAAFFSGLRIQHCTEESCAVTVPFNWRTKNPFRSTYFACLAMAAEMSTGALAMSKIYGRKPAVSMLITGMEAKYHKKATGLTTFICNEGGKLSEVIELAYQTAGSQTVTLKSEGFNTDKELVAEFWFTWSFKIRQ